MELRPYQSEDVEFHRTHPLSANWAEPGLGKTRTLLAAAEGSTLVVAPAIVRDTEVWTLEADRIGADRPDVVSYHDMLSLDSSEWTYDTVILDEMHRLKAGNKSAAKRVTWYDPIFALTGRTDRVHGGTGTPMPNAAFELWAQLRIFRRDERDFQYYWPWVRKWFEAAPTRFNTYGMSDRLIGCRCDPSAQSESCVHWQRFYEANIEGFAVRRLRDDVLPDLPPMSGADTPLWTPMTKKQQRVFDRLRVDAVASLPEYGITLEMLSQASQFVALCMAATGLSVVDPDADPKDVESGKLRAVAEHLSYRTEPVVLGCWYRNTAAALARICDRQKLHYVMMAGRATRKQRAKAVADFREGKVDVLIGSVAVIKEGVDGLQYGTNQIGIVERSWVPGDNEQLVRRIHRLGQTRPVDVLQWVTPQSPDSEQWTAVDGKNELIRRVMRPVEAATLFG